jgi:DNA processing protein
VRTPGIGPVTYRQLIRRFGSAAEALAAVPDLARRGGGKAPQLVSRDSAEREIAKVDKLGAKWLALGQGLYPRLLAEMEDAPPRRATSICSTGRRWRWSERAMPRPRRVASRAALPMT